jgi:pimeloyl-ACP methyl ester carboxylesterase
VPAIDTHGRPYPYDPETLADDAAALLQYLHVGNSSERGAAIIMGHSLGGVVASELAFRHPKLVRAIVLVDSAYYMPIPQGELIIASLKNASASSSPKVAASWFDTIESSVAERPAWMRAWRLRKTWGMPGYVVTAVFEQLIQFLGQWGSGTKYGVERKGVPKLATLSEQSYVDFENEIGLPEGDRVEVVGGGHWHFQINSTRFNSIVEEWFVAKGYI